MAQLFAPVGAALHALLIKVQEDLQYIDTTPPEDVTDAGSFQPLYADLRDLTDQVLSAYADVPVTTPDFTTGRFDVSPESQVSNYSSQAANWLQATAASYDPPPSGPGRSGVDAVLVFLRPLYAAVMQSVVDATCADLQDNAMSDPATVLTAADAVAAGLPS